MTPVAATTEYPPHIRGPRQSDQGYVASTWMRQLKLEDPESARGSRYGDVGRMVDAVFDRGDTRALIRHAPGDRDAIYGWVVFVEGPGVPLVHFCYIRREHRGRGYASQLLSAIGIRPTTAYVYTCRGPGTLRLLSKYKAGSHLPLKEFLS